MSLKNPSLKAKYQANKNFFVTCYLDIYEANARGVKAQVGIRTPGDTVLPVGTKLFLDMVPEFSPEQTAFEVYYLTVKGIEISAGVPLQVCSGIRKEQRENLRRHDRKQLNFDVGIQEMEGINFNVLNGSVYGLTMLYKASRRFLGLVCGQPYTLQVIYNDELFTLPAEVTHVHYDWGSYEHKLGVQFLPLNKDQEIVVSRLIDPLYKVNINQSVSVDTEQARIGADGF